METRDEIIDFVASWRAKTSFALGQYLTWLGVSQSTYYEWMRRYGQANQHNASLPKTFWLQEWEKQAIVRYAMVHPLIGYRCLSYMLLDENVVAVSPSSVYRVLKEAQLLGQPPAPSLKGTGFKQPLKLHEHWHTDLSYVSIAGIFYYLCCVLDGYSRFIVHWEIREGMTTDDVQIVLLRAHEKVPGATPRIITDNGSAYIARDFKEFIRISGMTHVRTSPYYPQSNGKIERFHKTIKEDCIRPKAPDSLQKAQTLIAEYIQTYNFQRLHSAIGYVTPNDKLQGNEQRIFQERALKLAQARSTREEERKKAQNQCAA